MVKDYLNLVRHPDNTALFQAIEMSILAAQSRVPLHLHAEGLRGTGKTSIFRAARGILPRIERIKGCLYNCDPQAPHCPLHSKLTATDIAELGSEWIAMPFLEVSHSAKVGTVVGGIDLEKLVSRSQPEAALLPGTLAQAHRGIIFIDEINRLADTSPELADILLDVMGTKPGRLQIEDPGLPQVELTSLVTVWAASNPDEDPGPLEGIRRQLADRFDLCIGVKRPSSHATLMAILEADETQREETLPASERHVIDTRLSGAQESLERLQVGREILSLLANIYLDHGLESLRALEAIILAAKLHAALTGKDQVEKSDLRTVLPLALKHRVAPHIIADIVEVLSGNLQPQVDNAWPTETVKAELSNEQSSGTRGFFSRFFSSLREPVSEGNAPIRATVATPMPHIGDEARAATVEAGLVNPELISIIAPPHTASPLSEVSESRLVMSEVELERER